MKFIRVGSPKVWLDHVKTIRIAFNSLPINPKWAINTTFAQHLSKDPIAETYRTAIFNWAITRLIWRIIQFRIQVPLSSVTIRFCITTLSARLSIQHLRWELNSDPTQTWSAQASHYTTGRVEFQSCNILISLYNYYRLCTVCGYICIHTSMKHT